MTDRQFDLADAIEATLEMDQTRAWTPSQMARKVRATTTEVRDVLAWMVEHRFAVAAGNGAWTKYSAR